MKTEERLSEIVRKLDDIVVTSGIDKGVILKSWDSPTHKEVVNGESLTVYDHENFSPLGDALIELYELASGGELRWYTWDQVSQDIWNGDIWWYDDGESIYPVNLGWVHEDGKSTPFATQGQWGWGRSRTLQEMGGRWRPCIEPEPDRAYRDCGG